MITVCALNYFEISFASRVLVRRDNSRRDRFLFAQAQTRRETRFQHVALAKISRGNSSQCALSTTATQLAFAFATASFDPRHSRVKPSLFRGQFQKRWVARGDS